MGDATKDPIKHKISFLLCFFALSACIWLRTAIAMTNVIDFWEMQLDMFQWTAKANNNLSRQRYGKNATK